jgi:hypothetical protein
MEESCFCETDKYAYPSLYNRLCCCLCTKEKETLIKLNCCGKYVHQSCFINSAIIRSNNIINSKDTSNTTKLSEIQICHYCQNPYDKKQFPNIPRTHEEIKLNHKMKVCTFIEYIMLLLATILTFSNALADNILLASNRNKGMNLYKNIFVSNCESNYTGSYTNADDINNYCSDSFYDETVWKMWTVCITSIFGFVVYCTVYDMRWHMHCELVENFLENRNVIRDKDFIIQHYKDAINNHKDIYKKFVLNLIVLALELTWQLAYLIIIVGYNKWYIPSHTFEDTTVEEARKLLLYYIPILCFFNIFWICFAVGLVITMYALIGGCMICLRGCFELWKEQREISRNKIRIGETNIKLYDIDVDDSLKKSDIV